MPTLTENLTRNPTEPTSRLAMDLAGRTQDVYGMDPNAERLGMLPYPHGALAGQTGPVDWTDWTAPQFVYDMAKSSLLPGHAARGGEWSPEDVTQMAMDLGGTGSMVGAAPVGSLGMFAGRRAKTANVGKLKRAERMRDAGSNRDDIWAETGWFQDVDGKWKYEIDDSAMKLTDPDNPADQIGWGVAGEGSALQHPDLAEAYPGMQNINHLISGKGDQGYYQAPQGRFGEELVAEAADPTKRRSTALHELQHATQGQEGFAHGGAEAQYASGPMFDRRATDLNADLSQSLTGGISTRPREVLEIMQYGDPTELSAIANKHGFGSVEDAATFLKSEDIKRTPFDQYRRLAGEAEARNVSNRADFTPEQRAAQPPWQTLDVPQDELIVRTMGGGGPQMSLPMDEASRMARAQEQGFHDSEFFHATRGDIEEFNLNPYNKNDELFGIHVGTKDQAQDIIKAGATERRLGKSDWSHGGNVMPLRIRGKKFLEMEDPGGHAWEANELLAQLANKDITVPIKDRFNPTIKEIRKGLQDKGYDGVVYKNIIEGSGADDSYIIFDPKNIRSPFAAFDPAQSGSANILAMNPATAAVPGILAQSLQERR